MDSYESLWVPMKNARCATPPPVRETTGELPVTARRPVSHSPYPLLLLPSLSRSSPAQLSIWSQRWLIFLRDRSRFTNLVSKEGVRIRSRYQSRQKEQEYQSMLEYIASLT